MKTEPSAPWPGEVPVVGPHFVQRLGAHGDAPALIGTSGEVVTYAELAERADEVRSRLGGLRRLVLVETAHRVDAVVTYLGALAGGHPVVLVPPGHRGTPELVERYDPGVVATEAAGWALAERKRARATELHPDLALLLSTSGSTGSPKLVRLSHRNVDSNAEAIAQYLCLDRDDRAITSLPWHYCYGLSVLHSHLVAGAAVVLCDASVVDPCFWAAVEDHGVTTIAGVPHTFDLLEHAGFDRRRVPSLRRVLQAGGRLDPMLVRRYAAMGRRDGWQLFVMYGQTEATARMAYVPPHLVEQHPDVIGVAIPGGSLRVDAPPGDAVGELVYQGPNVMLGYAEQVDDLSLGATLEELRTGDLATVGDDGLFRVVGRASRFVKPFGVRIDLDRVESELRRNGVRAVCTGDDRHVVVATEDPQPSCDTASLVVELTGLPRTAVSVLALDELPRLDNGKPDHQRLRQLADRTDTGTGGDRTDEGSAGAMPGRGTVRGIFADVLGVAGATDTDTFVGLGGDSLSYVETSVRLERVLGAVPRDWHLMTLGQLDALAAEHQPVAGRRFWRPMETNVVLRAVAIVLIVCTHGALFKQQGGAHLLLAVAGFNFARFQLGGSQLGGSQLGGSQSGGDGAGGAPADEGVGPSRRILASAARIAVPTLVFTWLAMATQEGFGSSNLLLVNNYVVDARWWYWYVEVVLQLLVVLALVFSVPAVRRWEHRAPFAFAAGLLVATLAVRAVPMAWGDWERPLILTHLIAWLFVLGWLAQRAGSAWQRAAVLVVVLLTVPGFFEDGSRELIVAAGVVLLLFVPRVWVPWPLHRAAGLLAGASLYIYLTHFHVYADLRDTYGPWWSVAGSLAVGLAAWWVAERIRRLGHTTLAPLLRRGSADRRPPSRDTATVPSS